MARTREHLLAWSMVAACAALNVALWAGLVLWAVAR